MSDIERGSAVFKPRARLLSLLGEQLITNEVIAVVELVKNAYDADATMVTVVLKKVIDEDEGQIIVEDNGTGMTLDTILNVWLEPGTEFRKSQHERGEKSTIFHRPLLGEKGIGRFAAHRLGDLVEVFSKAKDSELEVVVEVDWKMFEQSKYLDQIPIHWMTRTPKIFTGKKNGTRMVIMNLKTAWTADMVNNLREKLGALQTPLKEKYNFEIKIEAPEFPEVKEEKATLEEVIQTALYSLEGYVNEKGLLDANYHFKHDAFPRESRKIPITGDLRNKDPHFRLPSDEMSTPSCGSFVVRFFVWDLDPTTLKETVTRTFYDKSIKPYTGVRIHRDGFRVWPYGESGNDWLNLDGRRVNNPTKCLSNNQIIGIIDISKNDNPELVDKTDREGLILNDSYDDFRRLVISTINLFEIERRRDRDRINSLLESKKRRLDKTIVAIEGLREKMKKRDHLAVYGEEIDKIENAYETEVKDTIEPLIVSAGIGIAYAMPAHEINSAIKDLEEQIISLKSTLDRLGVGGRIGETVPNILKITDMIRDVASGALELTRRKGAEFSLYSAVDFAYYIKKPSIVSENILVTFKEKEKINIKGQKNLLMTCILNLLDNSIYWLSGVKEKHIKIVIDHDTGGRPRIILSDNGPGIRREDLPFLGEAYWTRKPYGTGLGLFISKRAMKANKGEIEYGFAGEEPDFLSGANFILKFSPEVEIKA